MRPCYRGRVIVTGAHSIQLPEPDGTAADTALDADPLGLAEPAVRGQEVAHLSNGDAPGDHHAHV